MVAEKTSREKCFVLEQIWYKAKEDVVRFVLYSEGKYDPLIFLLIYWEKVYPALNMVCSGEHTQISAYTICCFPI